MKIMAADPITDIEPVTIGMVATTLNCSGVIDIVRPFQFLSHTNCISSPLIQETKKTEKQKKSIAKQKMDQVQISETC